MPAHRTSKFRLGLLLLLAPLPSFLKRACYRWFFGYRVGRRVRIGLSVVDAGACELADDVRIGHLNFIVGVGRLSLGEHARVGHLNVVRGGEEVYVCGSPGFADAATTVLLDAGVPVGSIKVERFGPSG